MSVLALGTAQFGLPYGIANRRGQVSQSDIVEILARAKADGVNTIDTAIAYGESERFLGQAGLSGFTVITKLSAIPAQCVDVEGWIRGEVAGSLSRLNLDKLGGLLLHTPSQLLGDRGQELYVVLQALKAEGKVDKIGISIYAPTELDAICARYKIDLVQAPFNLVDRTLYTSGWLDKLKADGIEVHTRSAFLQGLLLMDREAMPSAFAAWSPLWDRWQAWLLQEGLTALQACLSFPLSFPQIDRVVVGVDSLAQFEQIFAVSCAAAPVPFPEISCEDEDLINPALWIKK